MVCGPKKIELHFEESGAVIRPIGLDLFVNRTEFDYARVNITKEAGNRLLELSKYREPVTIKSEGERLARLYLPDVEKNITVTEDESFVKLHDQLKILTHRKINKSYTGKKKLREIVNDLYSKGVKEDQYNVLLDHSSTGWVEFEADLGKTVFTAGNSPIFEDLVDKIDSFGRAINPFFLDDAEYDFEDVSVWKALQKVINELGIDIWVAKDGLLYLGNMYGDGGRRFTSMNSYAGGPSDKTAALSGLSATSPSDTVKEVRIRGGIVRDEEMKRDQSKFHIEAKSTRTDLDSGRTITKSVPMSVLPQSLKQMSINTMLNTYYRQNKGSATVDVLSSLDNEIDVRNIKPGDFFGIVGNKNCRREINTGGHFIDQVHHKLNKRDGWTANLDLTPIYPPGADIKTETYWFNPTTDEYMTRDDFEEYDGPTVGV